MGQDGGKIGGEGFIGATKCLNFVHMTTALLQWPDFCINKKDYLLSIATTIHTTSRHDAKT